MARTITVELVGNADQLTQAFGRAGQATQGFGDKIAGVGAGLTKTLTPAAAGIALLGKQAFGEWDTAIDTIRANTGATGKELDGLGQIVKNVGAKSTQPLSEIGQTVAELNRRLGLTGKPLEAMTQKFADLKQLNMPASVASITRLFGDWSVKTGKQAATMDALFRTSQETGIGIEKLAELMTNFGSPLRQLGIDFETSAAMFARFEKEGVNIQTVLPGLKMALKNFAKAGRDPAKALLETIDAIKNAKTAAQANTLAFEVFGARAGPDLAAAIREGRFELSDLINTVKTGKDTISGAAADTLDLGDKMDMLKNRLFGAIGPYGEFIALIGGGVAAIGPALMGIGALTTAIHGMNLALLANPIVLIIAGLVALGIALAVAWNKSETFRMVVTGAWEKIKTVTLTVFNTLRDFFSRWWPLILGIFTGGLVPLVVLVVRNWDAIKAKTVAIFNAVKSFLLEWWPVLAGALLGPVGLVVGLIVKNWDTVKSKTADAWSAIKTAVMTAVDGLIGFVKSIPGRIVAALGDLSRLLWNAGSSIIGGLIGGLKSRLDEVASLAGSIGGMIKGLKGPLPKDRKLLVPEGMAIMEGLARGMQSAMPDLKKTVSGIIPNVFTPGGIVRKAAVARVGADGPRVGVPIALPA